MLQFMYVCNAHLPFACLPLSKYDWNVLLNKQCKKRRARVVWLTNNGLCWCMKWIHCNFHLHNPMRCERLPRARDTAARSSIGETSKLRIAWKQIEMKCVNYNKHEIAKENKISLGATALKRIGSHFWKDETLDYEVNENISPTKWTEEKKKWAFKFMKMKW